MRKRVLLFILGFSILNFFLFPQDIHAQEVAIQCTDSTQNELLQEYAEQDLIEKDDDDNVVVSRCVECDVCGYCFTQPERGLEMPEDWADCAKCLYTDVFEEIEGVPDDEGGIDSVENLSNEDALRNLTLPITGDLGGIPQAPQPKKGRYYTQLGCFSTNGDDYFDSFAGGGGAGGPVAQIIRILFSVSGSLALLYLIYGAFVVMTAEGRPEKIQQGRGIITGSIVGVIFSLSAVLIVNIIGNQILQVPTTQSPIDIELKEIEGSDNQIMSIKPKQASTEFDILEARYTEGSVSCTSDMESIEPPEVDGEKVVICYPKGEEPFQGSTPFDVLEVSADATITKIILDGEIEINP